MSRLDVMRSLLRSAATGAGASLERLGMTTSLRQTVSTIMSRRLFIDDAHLTAAVARVPSVLAATVSTREGRVRIDASFRDDTQLLVSFTPLNATFAAHGAKELSVRVEPGTAAFDARSGDVFSALASEIASKLWGPFLRKQTEPGKTAFAHRDGDVLIMDLRTLPEVRSALGQRLNAAGIDALSLQGIVAEDGGLRLLPGFPGMPP